MNTSFTNTLRVYLRFYSMKQVEIFTPESLDEVQLQAYQRFTQIEEPTDMDVLTCFLGLSAKVLSAIPHKQILALKGSIMEVLGQEQSFIESFWMDGVEYGFIPDLDAMSYGEYLDLTDTFGDWEKMHIAMAVLYRPITNRRRGKYLITEYQGTHEQQDKMKRMPLSAALGAVVFFCDLLKDLTKAIPKYLAGQEEVKEAIAQASKRSFSESGVGIIKSLHLLRATLEDLTKLQESRFTSALSTSHIRQTIASTKPQNIEANDSSKVNV